MRNKDVFIALSDKKLKEIHAKLASVIELGEYDNFHSIWHVPQQFKSISEMEEWMSKNILEIGHAKSYYDHLERIANLPQVSIKPEDLHYLEYFLLMGEMPIVTVDVLHPGKNGFQNRIWETGDLFFRLHKAKKEDKKFTKLAKYYTELMPEEVKRQHGIVKASKLRKAYSRGKKKARSRKTNY